ncbi:MAG: DsrE family protein [Planctomycetales bacterium]|nr:DsrE family protein [Planctomycetales bacterium]
MTERKQVVIVLKHGKSDNGKNATLAFSCGLSALALGHKVTIFLTSDGAVWGYQGSSSGIAVQGFAPLQEVVSEYIESGGEILLCSVCHKTCSSGGPDHSASQPLLNKVRIAGFTTMVELSLQGSCITF